MSTFGNPARAQFERFFNTGETPVQGQPGAFAVNFADKKIWTFNGVGAPVLISRSLEPHNPALSYAIGDLTITGSTIWRAIAPQAVGAFNPVNWNRLSAEDTGTIADLSGSGVMSGGVISLLGGDSVQVTAGTGVILDSDNPAAPTQMDVTWGLLTGSVAAGGQVALLLTINNLGQLGSAPLSQFDAVRRDRIVLGFLYYDDAGNIVAFQNTPRIVGQTANDFVDLIVALGGPFKVSGVVMAAATGLQVQVSGGTVFALGSRWRAMPANPNLAVFAGGNPIVFDVIDLNGTIISAATSNVPNVVYESGNVPPGFATIHFIFGTPDGARFWLQLGQQTWTSIAAAEAALSTAWDSFQTPFTDRAGVVLVGAIVVLRNATNLSNPAQGRVASALAGPRITARFNTTGQETEFLRLDGSNAMTGPLDMSGNAVQNATIDEGVF